MDGVDNLFSEAILNVIHQYQEENDNVLIILDADFIDKGWGFAKRHKDIERKMQSSNICCPFFLYPNNHDDGDVEMLMESLARKDIHQSWWNCFEDYKMCVKGIHDDNGNLRYNIPNRKAKLHTFISSQQLSKSQRDKIGRGHWLFDNDTYWNMSGATLRPLLEFLEENLNG